MTATYVGVFGLSWATCVGIWSCDAFTAVSVVTKPLDLDESYKWN
jgi:hypothetical protein